MSAKLMAELNERKKVLSGQLEKLSETIKADSPEDEYERFFALEAELRSVSQRAEAIERVAELRQRAPLRPLRAGQDGDYGTRCRRDFSVTRALAYLSGLVQRDDVGLELELSAECARQANRAFTGFALPFEALERRVMTSGGDGVGLIGTDHLGNQFIDRMRNQLIVGRLGATILSGLVGNVEIPRNDSTDGHYWIGENVAVTPNERTIGSVSLAPKHCAMLTEYSRNLLLQSSPDIEALLRGDLSSELAVAVDHAAVQGGSPNEPVGVLNYLGVPTTGSSVISWSNIISALRTVEAANAVVSGWAGSAHTREELMTTPKQTGGVEGNFIMTDPNSLAGYPFYASQVLRDAGSPEIIALIAGQWSDLLVGYWSGVDILVNPYESTAYSKGNVQIRGIVSVDVEVRHAGSFCVIA